MLGASEETIEAPATAPHKEEARFTAGGSQSAHLERRQLLAVDQVELVRKKDEVFEARVEVRLLAERRHLRGAGA